MQPYLPNQIFIESAVLESRIAQNVLRNLPGVPIEIIESTDAKLAESRRLNPTIARAKRSLILAEFKGRFFKACPGQQSRGETKNVCCDYFVINFASNCHMECTYCYLQWYLNFPYMIVYANLDRLLNELSEALSDRSRFFRIGTGELADSLALDPITEYARPLVEFFSGQKNAVLELKTKSNCVENLLDLEHGGRTVIAWSVNPEFIQKTEEHKTSSLSQRLEAAARCVRAGYPVAFHFDPLIHYPDWEQGYRQTVEAIFRQIPAGHIAWISLGALRMAPDQRELMRQRFPKSKLPLGELILSQDGKLRYFKPIRTQMYDRLSNWIKQLGPAVRIYACMERPEVWRRSFGAIPESDSSLGDYLYRGPGL